MKDYTAELKECQCGFLALNKLLLTGYSDKSELQNSYHAM